MMCWCDDCCHNRDYECQLGADISISADHECNDFVDYIDTPMYKEKFWRMVEHFGRKYKREDCGKREKENGIVFFHLSKELKDFTNCTEEKTGLGFEYRHLKNRDNVKKLKEWIERLPDVETYPDEPEVEGKQ